MKTNKFLFPLFILTLGVFLFSCTNKVDHPLIAGSLERIGDTFEFTEGPATDKDGHVFFTDIPKNYIHYLTTEGEIKLFRDNSGGANGLYFDAHNNLYACEGNNRRLIFYTADGRYQILADNYRGKRFNKPNDLWVDPKGGIYFTDPAYGIPDSLLEMGGEHVYYFPPHRSEVLRVCDDLVRPNGIIGTPDGKIVYITDHHGKKTWQYHVREDGTLAGKKEFAPIGCDGLTMDEQYNVYLTHVANSSVDIYSPGGEMLVSIPVPESPTNVTFGGKDHSTLYITARTRFYSIDMNVKGIKPVKM